MKTQRDKQLDRERRELEKNAPPPGTEYSYSVELTMFQLFDIEQMAYQGLDLEQTRRRLMIPPQVWEAMLKGNPRLAEAVFAGRDRMTFEMSRTMASAGAGGDIVAARFMLERFGGKQYLPPSQKVELESKNPSHAAPTIDVVASVEGSFAEQRRLLASVFNRPVRDLPVEPNQTGAVETGASAIGAESGALGAADDSGAVSTSLPS